LNSNLTSVFRNEISFKVGIINIIKHSNTQTFLIYAIIIVQIDIINRRTLDGNVLFVIF